MQTLVQIQGAGIHLDLDHLIIGRLGLLAILAFLLTRGAVEAAVALLLQFTLYLRPGELIELKVGQVVSCVVLGKIKAENTTRSPGYSVDIGAEEPAFVPRGQVALRLSRWSLMSWLSSTSTSVSE